MKFLIVASALTAITLSPAAFAQNQTSNSSTSANSGQNLAAAQKIQQDLKKAGFTDVNVVAESFVVQAKSKDGDPVVMTIGPHGMSVFEAMKGSNSSSTTGSAASSSDKTSSPSNSSPSNSSKQ